MSSTSPSPSPALKRRAGAGGLMNFWKRKDKDKDKDKDKNAKDKNKKESTDTSAKNSPSIRTRLRSLSRGNLDEAGPSLSPRSRSLSSSDGHPNAIKPDTPAPVGDVINLVKDHGDLSELIPQLKNANSRPIKTIKLPRVPTLVSMCITYISENAEEIVKSGALKKIPTSSEFKTSGLKDKGKQQQQSRKKNRSNRRSFFDQNAAEVLSKAFDSLLRVPGAKYELLRILGIERLVDMALCGAIHIHEEISEADLSEIDWKAPIGKGAAGIIYKGVLTNIHQQKALVAVKKPFDDSLFVESMKDVIFGSIFEHPNVVRCLGAKTHGSEKLVAMEFCEIGSLFDIIHAENPADVPRPYTFNLVIQLAKGAAKGLAEIHKYGIVHRDVKSMNFLIDGNWEVKLCDFGTSRVVKRIMTATTGSWLWMAPEVLAGSKYSEKADVYSFSMVLWELVERRLPWQEIESWDIQKVVVQKKMRPALLTTMTSIELCPPPFKALIEACWHPNPEKRPPFERIVGYIEYMERISKRYEELPENKQIASSESAQEQLHSLLLLLEPHSWDKSKPLPKAKELNAVHSKVNKKIHTLLYTYSSKANLLPKSASEPNATINQSNEPTEKPPASTSSPNVPTKVQESEAPKPQRATTTETPSIPETPEIPESPETPEAPAPETSVTPSAPPDRVSSEKNVEKKYEEVTPATEIPGSSWLIPLPPLTHEGADSPSEPTKPIPKCPSVKQRPKIPQRVEKAPLPPLPTTKPSTTQTQVPAVSLGTSLPPAQSASKSPVSTPATTPKTAAGSPSKTGPRMVRSRSGGLIQLRHIPAEPTSTPAPAPAPPPKAAKVKRAKSGAFVKINPVSTTPSTPSSTTSTTPSPTKPLTSSPASTTQPFTKQLARSRSQTHSALPAKAPLNRTVSVATPKNVVPTSSSSSHNNESGSHVSSSTGGSSLRIKELLSIFNDKAKSASVVPTPSRSAVSPRGNQSSGSTSTSATPPPLGLRARSKTELPRPVR